MGFASAFQSGFSTASSAMKAREERKLKERIAQESERYGVTEGAYGQDLQQNIEQLRGLQAQDPGQAAIYEKSIEELTRRQGLTAPDFSVGSRAQNFGTREEAEMAARPMRTQGLAGVYRGAGEVEKADELETRAFEQQRSLAQEKRAQAQFDQQQKLSELQIEGAGLTLKKGRREAEELAKQDGFQAFAAENPNATTQQLKDAAFKQFKFSPKQWQDAVNIRLDIKEGEQKDFVLNVKNKLKGKNLQQIGSLYNTDPDFDDKTDLAIVPGKKGAVTLNFIDKATNKITGSQTFSNEALATEYLNKQATEPEVIGSWMINLREKEARIAASNRTSPGTPSLSQKVADAEKAFGRKFTEAEKSVFLGLTSRPGLGGDKPVEVPEAGIRVMVNGQLRVTDGEGGYVALGGVVPAERAAFLQEAGVPDNLIGQIDWSPDGRTIGFGGVQYDPRNPRDMRILNEQYSRLGANTNRVVEAQRNTPGQQAQRGLEFQRDQLNMPLYIAP